jgi:hypothetical protein
MFVYFVIIVILLLLTLVLLRRRYKVMWFYSPDCIHCKNMELEWFKVENTCKNKGISVEKVNIKDDIDGVVLRNYGIDVVPTILKVNSLGERVYYNGERDAYHIVEWMENS